MKSIDGLTYNKPMQWTPKSVMPFAYAKAPPLFVATDLRCYVPQTCALALSTLFLLAFSVSLYADTYTVYFDEQQPLESRVELDLGVPSVDAVALLVRGSNVVGSKIHNPMCDGSRGIRSHENSWVFPAGCQSIAWKVEHRRLETPSYDLSRQEPFYHQAGWWFFTEFGSLLRRPESVDAVLCGVWRGQRICRKVPAMDRPPLFLMIGGASFNVELPHAHVSVFSDGILDQSKLDRATSALHDQFMYLGTVLQAFRAPSSNIDLQLAWLGIDKGLGVIGGAAGDQAFLANYGLVDGSAPEMELTRLLVVSGHEYAHLLGLNDIGATWATESLASYYGFKSIQGTDKDAKVIIEQMSVPAPLIHFWRDLDASIIAATDMQQSLDDFLDLLANPRGRKDARLPDEFRSAIAEIIGEENLNAIANTYLQGGT